MFSIDIAGALVNLYKVIRQDRELQQWIKLVLSTLYSAFLGLCAAWGVSLLAKQAPWQAFGYGLLSSATSVLSVLLRSPQARSLLISAPRQVVEQYQKDGQVTIEPSQK